MRRLALLLILAACKAKTAAAPPVDAAPLPDAPPGIKRVGLTEQLEKEAGQRVTGTPSPEQVYDALDAAGLKVERRKQIVALSVGARYCMGGFLGNGTAVAVCEYLDEPGAARGRELALQRFRAAGKREIYVHKKTTVMVMSPADGGGDDATMQKVKQILESL